jgi:hypothetical protein
MISYDKKHRKMKLKEQGRKMMGPILDLLFEVPSRQAVNKSTKGLTTLL